MTLVLVLPTEDVASGYLEMWLLRDMDTWRTEDHPATVTPIRLVHFLVSLSTFFFTVVPQLLVSLVNLPTSKLFSYK